LNPPSITLFHFSLVRPVTLAALQKSADSSERIETTVREVDQVSIKVKNELRPVLKRLASENSPALAMAASQSKFDSLEYFWEK
jgi:hypothetical protein